MSRIVQHKKPHLFLPFFVSLYICGGLFSHA